MRELGLVEAPAGGGSAFPEIEELQLECRFSDCAHETEPGCAIRAALDEGTLDPERWDSYLKLEREQAWLETKHDPLAQAAARRRWKAMGQAGREALKAKGRR
jgi:ribosome biogenesis GTPase